MELLGGLDAAWLPTEVTYGGATVLVLPWTPSTVSRSASLPGRAYPPRPPRGSFEARRSSARDLSDVADLLIRGERAPSGDVRRLPDHQPNEVVAVHRTPCLGQQLVRQCQPGAQRVERGISLEPFALLDRGGGSRGSVGLASYASMIAGMAATTVRDAPIQRHALRRGHRPNRLPARPVGGVRADAPGRGRGAVPTAVMAVSDAHRGLGAIAVPGPTRPARSARTASTSLLRSPSRSSRPQSCSSWTRGGWTLHDPITRFVPGVQWRRQGRGHRLARADAHVRPPGHGHDAVPQEAADRRTGARAGLCAETPTFEPGSRYSYASDSFYLLAAAISRLTGLPFAEALRRRVLAPVGAEDIRFDPRALRSRIVRVHGVGVDNRLVQEVVLRFLARATLPGGGLWGSAERPAALRPVAAAARQRHWRRGSSPRRPSTR